MPIKWDFQGLLQIKLCVILELPYLQYKDDLAYKSCSILITFRDHREMLLPWLE